MIVVCSIDELPCPDRVHLFRIVFQVMADLTASSKGLSSWSQVLLSRRTRQYVYALCYYYNCKVYTHSPLANKRETQINTAFRRSARPTVPIFWPANFIDLMLGVYTTLDATCKGLLLKENGLAARKMINIETKAK